MDRRSFLAASTAALVSGGAGSALAQVTPTEKAPLILGPDPNTRAPRFKAPAGAIDTHTHVFGPVAKYPYAAGRTYTPPEAPLDMFKTLHAKIGVERAVLVNATVHGRDNRPVIDAIATSNGAYKGIGTIDGDFTDRELEDLARGGLMGCRFIFIARLGGMPDLADFDRLMDRIKGLGWVVDLYVDPKALELMTPRLAKLPMPYILDHMGSLNVADGIDHPNFQRLIALLKSDEKCWIKLSGPERASAAGAPFDDVIPFAQKFIATAPDRLLWGSDWPHPNLKVMPNDGDLIDLVARYAPDPATQRKLLVENPERLFKFPKVG